MKKLSILLLLVIGFNMNSQEVLPALEVLKDYQKVRDFTMSNNQTEAYVTAQSNLEERSVILRLSKKDNQWHQVSITSFSGHHKDLEPYLSPDNLKLFFVSNRPVHKDSIKVKDFDIWMVERNTINERWSAPKNMGAPINTEHNEFYPTVSNNGTMYYTSDGPKALGKDDIFVSHFTDGQYQTPSILNGGVNSDGYEYNAFIAPDESYLLFGAYNRKDGYGSGDNYISFKNEDGSWTQAKNLGDSINSKYMDYCPFVIDGALYFTSRRSNIKATHDTGSVKLLLDELNSYQNGSSRIYKIEFDPNTFRN